MTIGVITFTASAHADEVARMVDSNGYTPESASYELATREAAAVDVASKLVAAVPALTQQPSTRAVVVLSTAHLSGSTINLLDVTPVDRWPVAGGPIPFGYYIWAPEDADEDREIPSDLAKVLQWARVQGFDYVQFDADEDIRDDLPAFDHEDVMTRDQLAVAIQDRDAETITELRREIESLQREVKRLRENPAHPTA